MKIKIVVVGAGSREFGPATIRDILLSDLLDVQDLDLVLMDINEATLPEHLAYANDIARRLKRTSKISYTTDLDKALSGADYVITAIEIKRYHYWAQDFHIPRKYGFKQIYGENGGIGGLFHALRNFDPTIKIAKAMERVCPDAILLNYTNPLTKLCEVLLKTTKIQVIGLCHGVFQGKKQLSRILEMDVHNIDAKASGLNHFTWFHYIKDKDSGRDLYPELFERDAKANWLSEWDELALSRTLLRVYKMYPSPGANHIGEYIRWAEEFLGSSMLQYYYDPKDGDPWDAGKIPPFIYNLDTHPTSLPFYKESPAAIYPSHGDEDSDAICPSGELAIPIIEGLSCGEDVDLAAINILNNGSLVPGLPENAVIEIPAIIKGGKLTPEHMPKLPEAVLAMLRNQCSINQLLVDAYQEKSKDKLLQAILIDPTCHSYRAAIHCVNDLFERQAEVLPEMY